MTYLVDTEPWIDGIDSMGLTHGSPVPHAIEEKAMSEQKAGFRNWGSEVLRHWRDERAVALERSREAAREPQHMERIATCACSGYFHMGYAIDPFVFTPELPFRE